MTRFHFFLGGVHYTTKTAVKQRAIEILDAHVVSGLAVGGDDLLFALDLLALHPRADEKIGCGVDRIVVRHVSPSRCFHVCRVDGSEEQFSYMKCLNGDNHAIDVAQAMRREVRDQVDAVRDAFFAEHGEHGGPSALSTTTTSATLVTRSNCHVDHYAPDFVVLARDFLASRNLTVDQVAVDGAGRASFERSLRDATLAAAWRAYHEEHARLRVVTRRENLTRPRAR